MCWLGEKEHSHHRCGMCQHVDYPLKSKECKDCYKGRSCNWKERKGGDATDSGSFYRPPKDINF